MPNLIEVVLREVADIAADGTVARAKGQSHASAAHLLSRWASLQIAIGDMLQKAQAADQLTPDQFEFALDWLSSLDDMAGAEAETQLEALFTWRDETHPDWRQEVPECSTSDAAPATVAT